MNIETHQRMRQLMRLLSLETNYALAVGDFDRASSALTCQFEIAKDVQTPEFLITHLIGIAGAGIAFHDCHTWIAQPNSPNLYWALTSIDGNVIGRRSSYLGEVRLLRFGVEAFQSPETLDWTSQQWVDSLARDFAVILPGSDESENALRGVVSAMIVRGYPIAKQRLIAEGWDTDELENMETAQVFCICESLNLARAVDDCLKWSLLSPAELRQAVEANLALTGDTTLPGRAKNFENNDGFLTPFIPMMLPAFNAAEKASERAVVMLAGLRTVEALRMHVAETGEVPASLSEIHIVPVPNDPRTGDPFPYHVTDEAVEIVLPDVSYNGSRDIVYRFER
ncbi:MAG: hypothetical protein KDD65_06940 [Bacteroidetes bacterium]|nr:hypothetical protein [Bacteroidota bacterium]